MKRQNITEIAIYVVVILLVMRVVVVPLYGSVKAKRALLEEYTATYITKLNTVERHKAERTTEAKNKEGSEALLKGLYPAGTSVTSIQSEFLSQFIEVVEKKGMTVVNYEMPDPLATKKLTEIPVLIRLKGTPLMFRDSLKEMDKFEKIVRFKQFEVMTSAQTFTVNMTMSVFRMER